jgi:hypothetical protein
MLRIWAVAEGANPERWKDFNVPEHIKNKIIKGNLNELTELEYEILEKNLLWFRSPLLTGLLKLKPKWYKGLLPVQELSALKILKMPKFIEISGSDNFIDLIISFEQGKRISDDSFMASLEKIRSNFNIERMVGVPIIVGESTNPPYILVEGYTRCSAALLNQRSGILKEEKIPLILGTVSNLNEWYLNDDQNGLKLC